MTDDKSTEANTVLQERTSQRFSLEELKGFYDRRTEYMDSNTETYTTEEAHGIIRKAGSRNL